MTGARRWIGYVAMVIVFAIACGLLAWWQFSRLEEARDRVQRIETNWDAPIVPIADIFAAQEDFDIDDTWRRVTATGEYLPQDQLLVRGRPRDGLPGFEVLVPFRLEDGTVLVVDRGWVPTGASDDSPAVIPAPPTGTVTVTVRLKPGEPEIPGRGAPDGQVATIHLPTIDSVVDGPVALAAYGLLVEEDPAAESSPALPSRPEIDEGPHLSYALQWIIFALMGFAALAWGVRHEMRVRRGETALPSRPKRPTDADEEDAILDRAGR